MEDEGEAAGAGAGPPQARFPADDGPQRAARQGDGDGPPAGPRRRHAAREHEAGTGGRSRESPCCLLGLFGFLLVFSCVSLHFHWDMK